MGEVIRDGIVYPAFGHVIVSNASLQRPPSPYFSVKILELGQVGHQLPIWIYGNELTWDRLNELRIPWGTRSDLRYAFLQPNYSYVWELGTSVFSVIDASSVVTHYQNVTSISDLGISWDILESRQFIIKLTASYEWDAFLIASKIDPKSLSENRSYIWGQTDEYVKGVTHFLSGAMINIADPQTGETKVGIHQKFHIRGVQFLLSKALEMYASGNYPSNMFLQDHDRIGERSFLEHNGIKNDLGKLLMIHMFTRNKLSGTFPDSYPWMLFTTFKWLWDDDQDGQPYDPNGPGEARIYDRTFDLSPWWG